MFVDYTSLVVQHYQEKKSANALSLRLARPTPAKLKQECVAVCNERFLKKDEQTLRTFFGQSGDVKTSVQAIERCETDKFKPLVNFLTNRTNNTDDKNIELLAWLINFEPRPYEIGRKYGSNSSRVSDISNEDAQHNDDKVELISPAEISDSEKRVVNSDQQVISGKQSYKIKTKTAIGAIIILLSIGIVIYWPWSNKTSTALLTGHERCMYWAGDHYQLISCNQKLGDTLVVALDSNKLYRFKRITTPDTITQKSKGRVWYIKIKGNLEFYTTGGYHPVDPKLKLRPISDYIIEKYIHPMREVK